MVIEGAGATSPLALDPAMIEEQFRRRGALHLRGFAFDVDTFRGFAERLCATSVVNESPNRAALDQGSTIQSVDLGAEPFPLHPELSREPWRPDACLFACFDPPAKGGETTLCDGIAIVERLPPALVAAMRNRHLLHLQPAPPEILRFWLGTATPDPALLAAPPSACPYFFVRAGAQIIRGFAQPMLARPLFDERLAWGNFLLFARDFLRLPNFPCLDDGSDVPDDWLDEVRTAAAPITRAVAWRRGDILILDNSRFMHGRRAILDPAERRIASYFGYLGFAPAERVDCTAPWRRGAFTPPRPALRPAP